jgi:hypothetical protein
MKRKHKELPKVRNPFVLHLSKRPSGAHGKTKKAERRDAKVQVKKDYCEKYVYVFPSSIERLTKLVKY